MINSQLKYQIFISSTYKDLIHARSEVIGVILKLYHIPIGMEMFSADNEEQWDVIKDTIDNSDYYLLIVGHRYGTLTKERISYTEKEFNYAKSRKIPVLAFIRNRDIATRPEERDSDPALQKQLEKFVAKVTKNAMCDFWGTESELGQKVAIALPKFFHKSPRTGWVKADKAISPAVSEELAYLGRENRALREQLEELKSKSVTPKPAFSLKLNGMENLELFLQDDLVNEYNCLMEFDFDSLPNRYATHVSKEHISKLNEAVRKNKAEAEAYNLELLKYTAIKSARKNLTVEVKNTGSVKANDVVVELTFPTQLLVLKNEVANSYEPPTKPRSIFMQTPHEVTAAAMGKYISAPRNMADYSLRLNLHNPARARLTGNVLEKPIKSILHTRTVCIDDEYYIVPLERGDFQIHASIICEELSEKVEYIIPVSVKSA